MHYEIIDRYFNVFFVEIQLESSAVVAITTVQLYLTNPELRDSVQVQILLAVCRRFEMVRISDNGPGWK